MHIASSTTAAGPVGAHRLRAGGAARAPSRPSFLDRGDLAARTSRARSASRAPSCSWRWPAASSTPLTARHALGHRTLGRSPGAGEPAGGLGAARACRWPTSHLYAQGESRLPRRHHLAHDHRQRRPDHLDLHLARPPSSARAGTVNFPVTPSPDQAGDLMIASGYSRVDGGTWQQRLRGAAHAAAGGRRGRSVGRWPRRPSCRPSCESAGFAVSLIPASSATAAGSALADGSADLALLPRTTSPFLSQAVAWYSDPPRPPGPGRLAGLERATTTPPSTT